jgi:hypothetical protein
MDSKLKEWLIGRSPLFIIILVGGGYIVYSEGIASIEAITTTLIGIFCPCLFFVELLRLVFDKRLSKRNWTLFSLYFLLSLFMFLFLAKSDQTSLILIMDGIFCFFILLYVLIKRRLEKS